MSNTLSDHCSKIKVGLERVNGIGGSRQSAVSSRQSAIRNGLTGKLCTPEVVKWVGGLQITAAASTFT